MQEQVRGRFPAFAGTHEPKPLPFDPAKLPGLSERLLRSHWENNYCGAVKALNAVERRLAAMLEDPELPPYVYGDLKREELLRTGSVRLQPSSCGARRSWDHTCGAPGSHPLLVLDMYEHAYHLDYGAAAARYVDAFMQNVSWEEVSRRLVQAAAPRAGEHETFQTTWNPG